MVGRRWSANGHSGGGSVRVETIESIQKRDKYKQ